MNSPEAELVQSPIERLAEETPHRRPTAGELLVVGLMVAFTGFAAIWILPYIALSDRLRRYRARLGGPHR